MENKILAEKLYSEYGDYIRKLCSYKLQSSPENIEDCVQEVFLALADALKKGITIEYPKAYLTKTALNIIHDVYKQERQKEERLVPFEDEYIASSLTEFESSLSDEKIEKYREEILAKLTDAERSLIDDFYNCKIPQGKIAKKLGITENALRQKLFRIKRKVIKEIKKLEL